MTASGFVVGNIVKSKGDVEAAAGVNAMTVMASGTVTGNDIVATNKVSGAIGEIGGLLSAGSIQAKTIAATDGLTVNNVDVGPSILAMSAMIEEVRRSDSRGDELIEQLFYANQPHLPLYSLRSSQLQALVQGLNAKIGSLEKGLAEGVVEAGGLSVTEDEDG